MRLKIVAIAAGIFAFAVFAGVARASGGGTGVITGITIANGAQFGIIDVTNIPATGRPSCHQGGAGQFAFDISTAKGKGLLSLSEGAQLAGKTVGVGGSGTCITVQTGEQVEVLSIITAFTN